jgi:hypothetical protein
MNPIDWFRNVPVPSIYAAMLFVGMVMLTVCAILKDQE